jgi:putative heme-binding domain-containing protein
MTRKVYVTTCLALILTMQALVAQRRGQVGPAINENKATPLSRIKAPEGFKVELLYSVPGVEQGSWVNLCLDGKGRMIVSDQYGGLYRFEVPPLGQSLSKGAIEPVPAKVRAVNGMVWAFDSLYVGVNDYERKMPSGLYRLTDSTGDDQLDKVEALRTMGARGDHGVHQVVLAPDKESLFLITGNGTTPTEFQSSRVPAVWGEDHLLERMPDGRGHNRGVLAPGGIIYQITPDGKEWEAYSVGYRNIFGGAFNHDGELFTYDADMEYDFNTPWYRPTRINHVTSGSEYGWRNGTGKRPEWYPDNLPGSVNVGPGSPTGITFGYGAKFPKKYQQALFFLDWSWGKIYSVNLEPDGSSYTGQKEEFISGAPLPVTDAIINPNDGAMYFAIGGRRVQSGLYRVSYHGTESTKAIDPSIQNSKGATERKIRRQLEAYHGLVHDDAISTAWPYLDHEDRFLKWAGRTAIEHQPITSWAQRALNEADHGKRVEALLGLARVTGVDPFHRKDESFLPDTAMRDRILNSLTEVQWSRLTHDQQLTLVRTYEITLNRFGQPNTSLSNQIVNQLDPYFPAPTFQLNWLLCETLAYLQAPSVAGKAMALIQDAATQEEQMEYARSLRFLKKGWTNELHTQYFEWFLTASNYRGGASFSKFIEFIRNDAVASLSTAQKQDLKAILEKEPVSKSPLEALAEAMAGRSFVKEWEFEEITSAIETGLVNRNHAMGRKAFGAAGCFACHRFNNEGGMTGPDLTNAGGRYSAQDFIDQVFHPSKEINEQFVPIVLTKTDGDTVTGVIVNLNGDTVSVNTDLANPFQQERVDRKEVESIEPSKISTMPSGLLNILEKDEILDLVAYVLSQGNADHNYFK